MIIISFLVAVSTFFFQPFHTLQSWFPDLYKTHKTIHFLYKHPLLPHEGEVLIFSFLQIVYRFIIIIQLEPNNYSLVQNIF